MPLPPKRPQTATHGVVGLPAGADAQLGIQAAVDRHLREQQSSLTRLVRSIINVCEQGELNHLQTRGGLPTRQRVDEEVPLHPHFGVRRVSISTSTSSDPNASIEDTRLPAKHEAAASVTPFAPHTALVPPKANMVFSSGSGSESTAAVGSVGEIIRATRSRRTEQSMRSAGSRLGTQSYRYRVTVQSARGLRAADWGFFNGKSSDPYCVVQMVGREEKFQTRTVHKSLDPLWNETFDFDLCSRDDVLKFSIFDSDEVKKQDDYLGSTELPCESIFPTGFEGRLQLESGDGATLNVMVEVVTDTDPDALFKTRKKLKKWWFALAGIEKPHPDEEYTLPAKAVHNMVKQTQHPKNVISLEAVQEVIACLDEDDETEVLSLDKFAALIAWRGDYGFHENEENTKSAFIIRDALVKAGADRIIAKHARLCLPDEDSVERKSWTLALLEPISAFMILSNGIVIGLSSDIEWDRWPSIHVAYLVFFTVELFIKLWIFGLLQFYTNIDAQWNLFDTAIVVFGFLEFLFTYILTGGGASFFRELPLVRLARMARLTRLLRLLRLLRMKIFKELLLMVKGIVGGMRTLIWAVVLLMIINFLVSMVLRQTIGDAEVEMGGQKLFTSVLSSMFMVFRIFMGDNALSNGTPLAHHLFDRYGFVFGLPYTAVIAFIVFGIFNMIAALFVENVMATATAKRQLSVDGERARVAKHLRTLVLKFAGHHAQVVDFEQTSMMEGPATVRAIRCLQRCCQAIRKQFRSGDDGRSSLSKTQNKLNTMVGGSHSSEMNGLVTRDQFLEVIHEKDVQAAMDDLEIFCTDRAELFDILDADGSGSIDISELVSGLMKLRSSGGDLVIDSVATYLTIRSMQSTLQEIKESMTNVRARTGVRDRQSRATKSKRISVESRSQTG